MKRADRWTSFRYTASQLCFRERLHSFRLHENAFNIFFIVIDNQREILSYQSRQLPCRARGARAHNHCLHLPFCMDSFVHGNVFFFTFIDISVCTIQSNQTVDALITYVA